MKGFDLTPEGGEVAAGTGADIFYNGRMGAAGPSVQPWSPLTEKRGVQRDPHGKVSLLFYTSQHSGGSSFKKRCFAR